MSLTTAVRSINRSAKSKFPGATDSDVAPYVALVYKAAVTNLKSTYKDEDAVTSADKELAEAAERGESWAVSLRDAKLLKVIKPVVDNAVEKGVDPVTALILKDVPEAEAREYVAELASRLDADGPGDLGTDSADEPKDGDDQDSADSIDPFGADVDSADQPVGSSI